MSHVNVVPSISKVGYVFFSVAHMLSSDGSILLDTTANRSYMCALHSYVEDMRVYPVSSLTTCNAD